MANYNKSFNFRNGLQVDVDKFLITKTGLVGIGSTTPTKSLDVSGDVAVSGLTSSTNLGVSGNSEFYGDITIGSNIEIYPSTGNVHAQRYYGDGSFLGNIVGYHTEAFIVTRDPSTLVVTGIVTTAPVGLGRTTANSEYDLVVGTAISFTNAGTGYFSDVNVSNNITAGTISGTLDASNLSGTIDNGRFPSGIDVSGIITASSFEGSLTGTATNASGLTGSPNITVGDVTASHVKATSSNLGFTTITNTLHLDNTKIGIGTALPTSDIQIHRSDANSVLEVVSDNHKARIGLGNSLGMGGNNSAEIRFNNTHLQFYNYDVGNIDTIINDGTVAGTTGKFRWIHGQGNDVLMTLTYDGNLGINGTSPEHKLYVGGASTFTGTAYFSDNVTINGTLSFTESGSFTLPSLITSNINTSSGVSTINDARISSLTATNVDLGTKLTSEFGAIGIGTNTVTQGAQLDVKGMALFNTVGVGTNNVRAAVDFADANNYSGEAQALRFMLPPILTTTERDALSPLEGAVIYNKSLSKLQVCTAVGIDNNPDTWANLN